ncbi:hypothetical protein ACFVXA_24345 [Streptomyces sp. NPDC058246]|uniref:hypothetical protein n=1 Tax=Streptomyces sp. NPDC058246 TaxID=3346400 RepID=UPI0036EA9A6D
MICGRNTTGSSGSRPPRVSSAEPGRTEPLRQLDPVLNRSGLPDVRLGPLPTQRPGKPLTSLKPTGRLRNIGLPSEAARCAALLDLCVQMPPAVLQRLLGVTSFAAEP